MGKQRRARAAVHGTVPESAANRNRAIIGAIALVCLTLIAYWPALSGSMLWDDEGHVTKPVLQSLGGLWRIWFDPGATQQYYPLLHSAFWFEHQLWGDHLVGYHLVNIALHAASALLVAIAAGQLGLRGGWLAALVFALHPVHVESVAWISEQKNTLSTVFYLAAGVTYLRFDRTRRPRLYGAAFLLFLCAILSKSTGATLPAALLVVLWWHHGRLSWRRDVRPLIPWLVAGAVGGAFTAWMERTQIGAVGPDFNWTLLERGLIAGRVPWFYLSKLVWPVDLTFNYPRWTIDALDWRQYAFPVGTVAILATCWKIRGWNRGPLAAVLFFIGTLFPVLGLLNFYPMIYSYVADHFQYVASLGVIVPGAALAARLPLRPSVAPAIAVAFAVLLGTATHRQTRMYRDAETLYRATIARNPSSWLAHENLGIELVQRPDGLAEAITEFETVARMRPNSPSAHRNLAMALSKVPGRAKESVAEYESLLKLQSDRASDHLNLGGMLLDVPGRAKEALDHLATAVRLDPLSATAHYMLGNGLTQNGQPGAEAEYREALRLKPDFAEAHLNLGGLLSARPETLASACAEYEAAIRINPGYADAHYNLGNLLMEIPGRTPEAIAHFEAALRIQPEYAAAHHNLAIALLDEPGRTSDAVEHLQAALQIDPQMESSRKLLERLRVPAR
jgi:protein O-mannosyl-transferase